MYRSGQRNVCQGMYRGLTAADREWLARFNTEWATGKTKPGATRLMTKGQLKERRHADYLRRWQSYGRVVPTDLLSCDPSAALVTAYDRARERERPKIKSRGRAK